jgi:hypothetical protein
MLSAAFVKLGTHTEQIGGRMCSDGRGIPPQTTPSGYSIFICNGNFHIGDFPRWEKSVAKNVAAKLFFGLDLVLHDNRFSVLCKAKMKYAKRIVQGRMREMRTKLKFSIAVEY